MSFYVGRLDRKFISESANSPNENKLRFNDPSFITFRILFDFEPIVSSDEVMQGLLLDESRDESAISYLRRMGELERSEALKEFVWLLSKISNDFPWFFKSINGLDGLWKWGHTTNGTEGLVTVDDSASLTIDCYETVDLRMTALSDLYRKATRDRRFFRDLLTLDKRRFNMTILVGEARNLKTFVENNRSDWLNHVSCIAFRCLDCEFDFSSFNTTQLNASDAPPEMSSQFSIKVGRVQETNSYQLLSYMLGEIKRDLVIKQGGSGAEVNTANDIINYRSLLAPFVRSYEGNYQSVIDDYSKNVSQNFIQKITRNTGNRIASLPYPLRNRSERQQLDGISKEETFKSIAKSLLDGVRQNGDIENQEFIVNFGKPSVENQLTDPIDLNPEGDIKIEEEMGNQIEFERPKVETTLSEFSFTRPNVENDIDENVGLTKPTVETNLSESVTLTPPGVETNLGGSIELNPPGVETNIDANVGFERPKVETTIDDKIQFERPKVETSLDGISFGRPSVATEIDNEIKFIKPSVLSSITEDIKFAKPNVEDGFGS